MSGSNPVAINYVEFNVSDMARTKAFYAAAFGWSFTDYGDSYCEFTDGSMKGGFAVGGTVTVGGPLIVLYSDDLKTVAKQVLDAGGTIVKPEFAFPGGRRFQFTDPDGYELAVWCSD